jgi:hypothetical protein
MLAQIKALMPHSVIVEGGAWYVKMMVLAFMHNDHLVSLWTLKLKQRLVVDILYLPHLTEVRLQETQCSVRQLAQLFSSSRPLRCIKLVGAVPDSRKGDPLPMHNSFTLSCSTICLSDHISFVHELVQILPHPSDTLSVDVEVHYGTVGERR